MGDLLFRHQETLGLQVTHHHIVALGIVLPLVTGIGHNALGVHRHGDLDMGQPGGIIPCANVKVLGAETGSGVDTAGAGLQRNVVAVQNDGILIQQGVLCRHQLKLAALQGGQNGTGGIVDARLFADPLGQFLGHDIDLSIGDLKQYIVKPGIEGDGHVARDGPGGGGPDDKEEFGQIAVPAQLALVVLHGELYKDGGTGVVLIFDFGLGQSGLVVGAPIDRLHAFIDKALLGHLAEDLDLPGLKLGLQGDIGVFPLTQNPQPLELGRHLLDVAQRKLLALVPELGGGHFLPLHRLILQYSGLDGQAVGVPAGDIGGLNAGHVPGFDDDILQNLVHGGADMDIAVGIGGAVMEDEGGLTLIAGHHLLIEILFVHGLQHIRLPLGQCGPHGKVGLGKVDGVVVIHGNFSFI